MPTHKSKQLMPCRICGGRPALESWASGGPMFAVRCDNPYRPDICGEAFYFSESRDRDESIEKWNLFQSAPWKDDSITRRYLRNHFAELRSVENMTPNELATTCTYCDSCDNLFAAELAKRAGKGQEFTRATSEDEKVRVLRLAAASFKIIMF